MAYGSCFGNDISWSQASALQNTFYVITDTDIDDGVESSVTNVDGVMTIGTDGTYQIVYSVGVVSSARRIEVGLLINSTVSTNGRSFAHFDSGTGGQTISGTAILTLSQTNTVSLVIRTTDGGQPTLRVDSVNMAIATVT